MEALLFLFPQFNYMAPKEEAYFKILSPEDLQAPTMKDDSSRLVCETLFSSVFCVVSLRALVQLAVNVRNDSIVTSFS